MACVTAQWRTCEQLWSHVDGRSNDAAGHHGLWFTEAQVCDLCTILLVQLEEEEKIKGAQSLLGRKTISFQGK